MATTTELTQVEQETASTEQTPYRNIFEGLSADETSGDEKSTPEAEEKSEETVTPEKAEAAEETAQEVDDSKVPEKSAQADQQPPAGVSPILRELAITNGLPMLMVDFCYDDLQLQTLLDWKRTSKEKDREKTEKEDPPTLKLLIPEDEFDAQDPIHAQQKHLVDGINQTLQQFRREIDESILSGSNLVAERQKEFQAGLKQDYDSALDGLDREILGERGSQQREESWPLYLMLLSSQPEKDHQQLAVQAARATHENLVAATAVKAQQKNLDKQKKRTLGGGASPAPIETPTNPMDDFKNYLRSVSYDN